MMVKLFLLGISVVIEAIFLFMKVLSLPQNIAGTMFKKILLYIISCFFVINVFSQAPTINCVQGYAFNSTITINGNNFTGATSVILNGGGVSVSSFTVNAPVMITVNLNGGISPTLYQLYVTTPKGTGSIMFSPSNFFSISSFSPSVIGPEDTLTVNVNGNLFSSNNSINSNCGVLSGSALSQSSNQYKFIISGGCQNAGTIYLQNINYGSCSPTAAPLDGLTFNATPIINSVFPLSGKTGDTIIISGKYLYTNNIKPTVTFGGSPAAAVIPVSNRMIKAVVGTGASGNVAVTNSYNTTGTYPGFTYIVPAPPTLTLFSPASQLTGDTVVLIGTNFLAPLTVSFGGVLATSVTIVSPTTIKAVVGAGASGSVSVTTQGGTVSLPGFIIPEPSITSFTPTTQIKGGTVTITGTNLKGATVVSFGGVAATSFNVVSATTITAVIGQGASGNVSVTTSGGTATKSGFTITPPTITSFTPTSQITGGTVSISGTGLTGTTAVSFGGVPATSFNVINATSMTAVVAGGATGIVSITTPGGTATLSGFTFIPPAPTVTSFTPASQITGGTVTIAGTNFIGVTSVKFGGVAATSFEVISPTSITAVVGAGASGSVSVTALGGSGSKTGFTITAPIISSFVPTSATQADTVTITGTGLTGATAVTFGGQNASAYNIISSTTIKAVVGTRASGQIAVTTGGGIASLSGFIFIPPVPTITSFSPSTQTAGGVVVINGTHLDSVTSVKFGGVEAYSFTHNNDSSITAIVGSGNNGNVSVTSIGGTGTLAGFIYAVAPVITSFAPASGPVGTTVTIVGDNFNTIPANNIVIVGGVRAQVTLASKTTLSIIVPAGAAFTPITVSTNNLTAYAALSFLVTFPGNDITQNSFPAKIDYATGVIGTALAYGDIDGDGKQDIVITRPDTVSIFRNISITDSIILAPRIDIQMANNGSLAVGDVNSDGRPEVVCMNGSTMYILRNTTSAGNISFTKENFTGYDGKPALADMNNDGKTDIVIQYYNGAYIIRNTGNAGTLSFAAPVSKVIFDNTCLVAALTDFDGDGKTDIVLGNHYQVSVSAIAILKNASTPNVLSFTYLTPQTAYGGPGIHEGIVAGDYNGDGKADIVYSNTSDYVTCGSQKCLEGGTKVKAINNLNNTITAGTAPLQLSNSTSYPGVLSAGSLNGDDKPDLISSAVGSTVSFMQNLSTVSTISFSHLDFASGGTAPFGYITRTAIVDLDGDGKSDVVGLNGYLPNIAIVKNKTGAPYSVCPGGNIILNSNLTGSTYQWQLNTVNGFNNIAADIHYSGVNGPALSISNIPSSFYGYQYRCVVDGANSYASSLKIAEMYIGTISTDQNWATATNWSCNVVPDAFTDVIIESGTVNINTDAYCRTLMVKPGATVNVSPDATLHIMH